MYITLFNFLSNLIYVFRDIGLFFTQSIPGTDFNLLTVISVSGIVFIIGWKIYHLVNPIA